MFKSFLKISLRYLWRRKTYSFLNFACLTFGLTCAIIAAFYIRNILNHDKFHKNYDRLYSVEAFVTYFNGARFPKEYLSASLPVLLREHSPEISDITRITERDYTFFNNDKSFIEKGIYADSNFFEVFTFPMISKTGTNVLSGPGSIVISRSMAAKFFNDKDCVGQSLVLKDGERKASFTISGVFNDVPSGSTLRFDFVIPFNSFLAENKWAMEADATSNQTWVLLAENAERSLVENKIKDLIKGQEATLNQDLFLFPLKEKMVYGYAAGRRVWKGMQTVVIAGSIGLSILLIACFNYINLSIALNFRRYREAGIKKVAGASKAGIVIHFLGETFMLTAISLAFSIILTKLLLTGFNTLFAYHIPVKPDPGMAIFLMIIAVFTSLLSGLMPGLYLSSSEPADIIKGKTVMTNSYNLFRQSLIVLQFAIPVIMIIVMMVIRAQDRYMREFNVGVDKDRVIVLENSKKIEEHHDAVKTELLTIPGIDAVSFTSCIPSRGTRVSSEVGWDGKDVTQKLHFWCINSDTDYNKTVDLKISDGRFFNSSFSTDSDSYLINDVAAAVMKNENPVGSQIVVEGKKGTVIGVFRDFHAIDLAGPIVPCIISLKRNDLSNILVKFSSGSFVSVNESVKRVIEKYDNETPYKATLFRDLVPYSDLNMPTKISALAFVFSILLACLGLFGLTSFTAENRTKEIGVRKANGATTISVMGLLLKDYAKWLIISFLIALPIAFLLAKIFLGRFYFHTPMPVISFLAGPVISFLLAMLTVSIQTWKAADRNPVESLRYE